MSITSHDFSARRRRSRFAAALVFVTLALGGAEPVVEAQTATRTPTPLPTITATPRLERVAVAPATAKRQVGQTQNFTVTGIFSDGSEKNFTQKVIYSSSDLNVVFPPNTVGNAGLVEAVGPGTAVISVTEPVTGINSNASNESATMEVVVAPTPTPTRTGATPTKTLTPTPTVTATPTLVSVAVAPATAKRGVGQTQNFSATGTYSDGSTKNLTQIVTYASSNANVAQAPNQVGNKGLVLAVGAGVATISASEPSSGISSNASGGSAEFTVVVAPTPTPTRTGTTPTPTLSPTPTATATPVLVSLALSPTTTKRGIGSFQNFVATGTFSDGSTKNLTQRADYASSDPTVASAPNEAGNKGKVIAVGVGIATISAVDTLTGIGTAVSAGNATMEVVVAPTPTPTRTGATPTKTRTPTPTVTATPKLVSVALAPATAKRGVGQTQNFSATGTYSDGSQKNLTQLVTYASSKSTVAQAPNQAGNKGLVLAVGAGVATISASEPSSGISSNASGGSAEFTVVVAPTPTPTRTGTTPTPTLSPTPTATATPVLVSLALSPTTTKRGIGSFQNFVATGTFSDGSTKNLTQRADYASSDPTIASAPNEAGNKGKVIAVGVGVATISAVDTLTGIGTAASAGNATMEVVVAPTPTPTRTGATPTKTRTPTPKPTATPKLVSLTLAPATAKRGVGQTQNFSATGTYSDGSTKNLTQIVTYASSKSTVAQAPNQAGNKGLVLAVGAGVATISASEPSSGISSNASGGSAEFTVVVAPTPTPTRTGSTPTPTLSPTPTATATPVLVSLALSPTTTKRGIGSFQNFVATGTFSDGSTKNLTQRADYASSDPTIASAPNEAGNKGKVIAVGVGVATISAVDTLTGIGTTSAGNATMEVIVAPTPTPTRTGLTPTRTKTPTPTPTSTPRLVSLAISPASVKKAAGLFQNFSVNGTYSDGNTKNLTQRVDYTSSDPSVASAPNEDGNKGKVIAVGVGVATISAKDPLTGISTTSDGNATFTVTQAPSPTPTRTGPTSTAPSPTPTLSGSPTPTATPVLTGIALAPKTAQKPVGAVQNFTAIGTFSDGNTHNVTQRLEYSSSEPTVASAPNESGNRGKIIALGVGTTTISAIDPITGISSAASDGNATLTIVQGKGTPSPSPSVTATPGSPIQTGNPTTTCQRGVQRATRSFVERKLKTLERCGGAASRCIQRKPNDPGCLTAVRARCAAAATKLADDEARLIATVIRRCATLSPGEIFGQDGLAYEDIASSCHDDFGWTLTDVTSVAQCLVAQHSCRAETLFALERPRAGEFLGLVDASPGPRSCRESFGGSGLGVGDPKGVGKLLERCGQEIVRSGAGLTLARLAAIGRCIDGVFVCVDAGSGNAQCLATATQQCANEFARIQRHVAKVAIKIGKSCNGVDFAVLGGPLGAYLDAVAPTCPSYGTPSVSSVTDYVACLVRQHECDVADLVRFESPRADEMLDRVDRKLVDGICPTP